MDINSINQSVYSKTSEGKSAGKALPDQADFKKMLEEASASQYRANPEDTLESIVRQRLYQTGGKITPEIIADAVNKTAEANNILPPYQIETGQKIDLTVLGDPVWKTDTLKEPPDHLPPPAPPPSLKTTEDQPLSAVIEEHAPPAKEIDKPVDIPPMKESPPGRSFSEQISLYRTDQLMSAPGGDNYVYKNNRIYYVPDYNHSNFSGRISKNLKDAQANAGLFLRDLTIGSEQNITLPDGTEKIKKRTGLLGTIGNFVKNMGSGLTFGAYTPKGESAPEGAGRITHFFSKVFREAILNDIVAGVPKAAVSATRHAILSAWNSLEIIPDATIGNFQAGQKLTTTIFDNGQVAVSYLTDVAPGGEAWFRVHATGAKDEGLNMPIIYNLKTSEQGIDDPRWEAIHNTPFRKTVETVGTLLADNFILSIFRLNPIPYISVNKD